MDTNVFSCFCFKCGERLLPDHKQCWYCKADQSDIEKLNSDELYSLGQKYEPAMRDFERAAYFYGLASEKGDDDASDKLALFFNVGLGVNPSEEKAQYYASLRHKQMEERLAKFKKKD